jgi:hypothetical protein
MSSLLPPSAMARQLPANSGVMPLKAPANLTTSAAIKAVTSKMQEIAITSVLGGFCTAGSLATGSL